VFYKPLYINAIYMCVVVLGFIILFFGYQYTKDPPQGAYIEKIMFSFLVYCTIEVLHAWSVISLVEWETLVEYYIVGRWVSIVALMAIITFFALRLRFITSPKGAFYEEEIAANPSQVTRWRDAFDTLVVTHFVESPKVIGRMFVDPNRK